MRKFMMMIMSLVFILALTGCAGSLPDIKNTQLSNDGKVAVMHSMGVSGTLPPEAMTRNVKVPAIAVDDLFALTVDEQVTALVNYSNELEAALTRANSKLSAISVWDGHGAIIIVNEVNTSSNATEMVNVITAGLLRRYVGGDKNVLFKQDVNETK